MAQENCYVYEPLLIIEVHSSLSLVVGRGEARGAHIGPITLPQWVWRTSWGKSVTIQKSVDVQNLQELQLPPEALEGQQHLHPLEVQLQNIQKKKKLP